MPPATLVNMGRTYGMAHGSARPTPGRMTRNDRARVDHGRPRSGPTARPNRRVQHSQRVHTNRQTQHDRHAAQMRQYMGRDRPEWTRGIYEIAHRVGRPMVGRNVRSSAQRRAATLRRHTPYPTRQVEVNGGLRTPEIGRLIDRIDELSDIHRDLGSIMAPLDVNADLQDQTNELRLLRLSELSTALRRLEELGMPRYPEYLMYHPSV